MPAGSAVGAVTRAPVACATVVVVNPLPLPATHAAGAEARERFSGGRVVVIKPPVAGGDLVACIRAGAEGFVLPDAPVDELTETIHQVARGTKVLPDPLVKPLFTYLRDGPAHWSRTAGQEALVGLTVRQGQIALLVAEGLTNQAIAARLGIEVHTGKTHVHAILDRLGLGSRLQLAVRARGVAAGGGGSRWSGRG